MSPSPIPCAAVRLGRGRVVRSNEFANFTGDGESDVLELSVGRRDRLRSPPDVAGHGFDERTCWSVP
jgi:hypothetical protein